MSSSKKHRVPKYRPVLTATQILKVLELAKKEVPISSDSFSLISTLSVFAAKIENQAITPAYIEEPPALKVSTLEALGGTLCADASIGVTEQLPEGMSKEAVWAVSYSKYKLDAASCSLQEIQEAQEHMYLNDMMTAEEILAFESSLEKGN